MYSAYSCEKAYWRQSDRFHLTSKKNCILRLAQPGGRLDKRIKHRLQVERRAADSARRCCRSAKNFPDARRTENLAFLDSASAMRLVRAYAALPTPRMKRALVRLAEQMAGVSMPTEKR